MFNYSIVPMKKMGRYWLIAIVVTLCALVYQKITGPTYPARMEVVLDGKKYKLSLPRSNDGRINCPIKLNIPDTAVQGTVFYRRYQSNEVWQTLPMTHQNNKLSVLLPNLPPAGKFEYHIKLFLKSMSTDISAEKPVVVRYRGDVPAFILLPHVFFMFFAMLLSNLSGLLAFGKIPSFRKYTIYAFIALIIGGMILGPLVQKYSFGQLWTGIPFGKDLTDNKTLIAFAFFLLAAVGNLKKERRYLTILAALVLLVVFSIPHSLFGSQLNYATGKVIQGFISLHWIF